MTRIPTRTVAACTAALMLCACQSVGNGRAFNASPAEASAILRIGSTSKTQVEQAFGPASVHRFANGYEAWTYQKTVGLPKFVKYVPYVNLFTARIDDRTTELALLFSPDGILRNVARHASAG